MKKNNKSNVISNLRNHTKIFGRKTRWAIKWHEKNGKKCFPKLNQEVIASYDEKIEQFEELLTAHLFRAIEHLEQEEYEEAFYVLCKLEFVEDLQMPGYLSRNGIQFLLGIAYIGMREFSEAIDCLNKFIVGGTKGKKSPDANYLLGYSYYQEGDLKNAEKYLHYAIQLDPEFERAYVSLGKVHSQLLLWEKAKADFSKALHLNPKNAEVGLCLELVESIQDKFRKLLKDKEEFEVIL